MKKVPNDIPGELAKRFPEYVDQIAQLLKENNGFTEIMDDYRFCLCKLSRLRDSPGKVNPLRMHYLNAARDLEDDMMGYFES